MSCWAGVKCEFELAQVRQEDLTRMDKGKREAMNATRTAFGADYEANLRMEAGPNPEKLARRKHQISSLYHQAKMKVCEKCLSCKRYSEVPLDPTAFCFAMPPPK